MSASPLKPDRISNDNFARLTNVETGITAKASGTQATATQLGAQVSRVDTVASGNDAVKLPKIVASPNRLDTAGVSVGTPMLISNSGASSMQLFGGLLDTINGIASATGVAVAAGVNVLLTPVDLNATTGVGTWLMTNAQAATVAAITSGTIAGVAITNSSFTGTQVTPATAADTATLSAANLLTRIVVGTPTAAAAYTLPTGSNMDLAATFATNECFDWSIINVATNATYIITLTANTSHTIVGEPNVAADTSTTGVLYGASAHFRTRKTAANTFVTYRIA